MASGLSDSTASGAMCDGSNDDLWMKDMDGLRMAGQCGFYSAPNFGMVEVTSASCKCLPPYSRHQAQLENKVCFKAHKFLTRTVYGP